MIFFNLLDAAQSSFTEEEVGDFTDSEKQCLKFIEKLLGDRASARFKNKKELEQAAKTLYDIFR
jgi:hypothetical protein